MKALFAIDADLGNLLAAMAAVERLKILNPKLRIEIATPYESQVKLLKRAWFISNTQVTPYSKVENPEQYDIVHELTTDREVATIEEYKRRSIAKNYIDKQVEQVAKQNNVSADAVEKPEIYESLSAEVPPNWTVAHGYAYNIMDATGWDCYFNEESPRPWVPAVSKSISNAYLHANKDTIKPGKDYCIVDNLTWFEDIKKTSIVYPDSWECVHIDESEMDAELIVGLIQNSRCKLVIGPTGGAIYSAWADDLPAIEANSNKVDFIYWSSNRSKLATVISSESESFSTSFPEIIKRFLTKRYNLSWQTT